jgi:hypothetical protein
MLWCLYINLFHWKDLWVIYFWNWEHQHITLWIQENNGFMKKSLEEILSFATKKSITKCFKQLVIDYNRMLFQILHINNCSHIIMVHLTTRWWHGNRKDDVFFITSFHPYGIHDWWQNDVDVQNMIWNCD